MKGLLNGTVKLVMLQFSFSNIKVIPVGLFKKQKETLKELNARKSEVKGT
jgi:predicted class III extradiol MEMO1 family dioxygenase